MQVTNYIRCRNRNIDTGRPNRQNLALNILQSFCFTASLATLLLLPVTTFAGSIVGISVSNTFPAIQEDINVSVSGNDVCNFDLELGDGYTLQNQTHNFEDSSWSVVHNWQVTGTKVITAIGRGDCADTSASTTVYVQNTNSVLSPNLNLLCKIFDCGKSKIDPAKIKDMHMFLTPKTKDPYKWLQEMAQKITPLIEGAISFPGWGSITPGATLALKGRNFQPKNNEQVQVMVLGNFPGGSLQLGGIEILSDTAITAVVPPAMTGILDQIVQIQIKKGSILGNKFDFAYIGPRQQRMLKVDDPAVQVIHCGHDANTNECNNYGNSTFGWSITGLHVNSWAAVGDDEDTDHFKITLKNGWVFKSFEKIQWWKTSEDERLWGPTPAFPEGESVWDFKIKWLVSPNDKVMYGCNIIIEGPEGTSPW